MDIASTRSLGGHALWVCFSAAAMKQKHVAVEDGCHAFDTIIDALGLEKIIDSGEYPLFNDVKDQVNWKQFHAYYTNKPFTISTNHLPPSVRSAIKALEGKDMVIPNGLFGNAIAKNTKNTWLYRGFTRDPNTIIVENLALKDGKSKQLSTIFNLEGGHKIVINNTQDYTALACIISRAKSVQGIVGTLSPLAIASGVPTISVTDKKNDYWIQRTPGGRQNCVFL